MPIENIWAIIKQRLDEKEITNLNSLKLNIKKIWRELDSDKKLCRKMIESISWHLATVIATLWAVVNLISNRTCPVCTGLPNNSVYRPDPIVQYVAVLA